VYLACIMILYIGVSTYIMEPCVRGKSGQFPEVGTDKYDAVLCMTGVRSDARNQGISCIRH